jgi:hypothetical protein
MSYTGFSKMYKQIKRLAYLSTVSALVVFAQNTAGLGNITGTVQDASGAVSSGVKVVVDNAQKGIHREIETTSSGAFSAPALVPASGYKVSITESGLAPSR